MGVRLQVHLGSSIRDDDSEKKMLESLIASQSVDRELVTSLSIFLFDQKTYGIHQVQALP